MEISSSILRYRINITQMNILSALSYLFSMISVSNSRIVQRFHKYFVPFQVCNIMLNYNKDISPAWKVLENLHSSPLQILYLSFISESILKYPTENSIITESMD